MSPLLVGALVAVVALAFVLWPIVRARGSAGPAGAPAPSASEARGSAPALAPPDEPPPSLTAEERAALAEEAEALVRRLRVRRACPVCGPRPELGARYCSTCGRDLVRRCDRCGTEVSPEGERVCRACGDPVA